VCECGTGGRAQRGGIEHVGARTSAQTIATIISSNVLGVQRDRRRVGMQMDAILLVAKRRVDRDSGDGRVGDRHYQTARRGAELIPAVGACGRREEGREPYGDGIGGRQEQREAQQHDEGGATR